METIASIFDEMRVVVESEWRELRDVEKLRHRDDDPRDSYIPGGPSASQGPKNEAADSH